MGEHLFNPNSQLAKEGKLPKKKQKMSKRQRERMIMQMCKKATGLDKLERVMFQGRKGGPYV